MNIREAWLRVRAVLCRKVRCKCGHIAKRFTTLIIDGSEGVYKISDPLEQYCPECWQKAAIKCARCEKIILPGDSVAIYTLESRAIVHKDAVIFHDGENRSAITCARQTCSMMGLDLCGTWSEKGEVVKFITTPMEKIQRAIEAGQPAIINI